MERKRKNKTELIISSRVTLLRNFKEYLFPTTLDYETSEFIASEVVKIFNDDKKYKIYDINETKEKEKDIEMLKTNGIIDKDYMKDYLKKIVIATVDLNQSIAINSKNHIEITSYAEGENLDLAYEKAKDIYKQIEENFEIAYDEKVGYQTTNVSNIGIGMKAEYIVHIPLLDISGQIGNLRGIMQRMGYSVVPMYGENLSASGGIFKISALNTFNQSVEEYFSNLKKIVMQITEKEQLLREEMLSKEYERMEDEVCRAYGILTNARLISEKESVILLSYLRLGMQLNLLDNKNLKGKNPIMILKDSLGGNFKYKNKAKLSQLELDIKRANYIKERLLI